MGHSLAKSKTYTEKKNKRATHFETYNVSLCTHTHTVSHAQPPSIHLFP